MNLMEQKRLKPPRPRLKAYAALGLASILAFTGCSAQASPKANRTPNAKVAIKPRVSTDIGVDEMASRALDEFREEFNTRRTANVLIGWCIGWPTDRGKITVTLNPGLKDYKNGQEDLMMNVFSFVNQASVSTSATGTPDIIFLNGASSYTNSMGRQLSDFDTTIVLASSKPPAGVKTFNLNRHISEEPSQGADGIWAYTDIESGIPVIKSRVVDGPFDANRVSQVCDAMRVGPKS